MGIGRVKAKSYVAGSLAAITVTAMVMVAAGSGASATGRDARQARPHGLVQKLPTSHTNGPAQPYTVTSFSQQFKYNTDGFCAGPGNAPCDGNGAANDYGTIDRVASGFSNGGYGNYAPATTAPHGEDWMAVVSGTGDGNQGAGCPGTTATPNPGETCTGPYALFGTGSAAGVENVFPTRGFTVTDDLYLSPSTAPGAGALVDDDVELNNSSGDGPAGLPYYGIDNIITACAEPTSPGGPLGFYINFGNGSPGSCAVTANTPVITIDGWYRFVFDFNNAGGYAFLTESVLSESPHGVVATSTPLPVGGTPTSVSNWGGPGYFWLPSEDMSGLPLANFALQLGNHPNGHTP
jgi:hypothetical protein